jgi:hypothetical protein
VKLAVRHIQVVGMPGGWPPASSPCGGADADEARSDGGVCRVKHAVRHIHFVGMPGVGPRHRHPAVAPLPTKRTATGEFAA